MAGMRCPECDGETKVADTRDKTDYVYRRRKCLACGHLFTTNERVCGTWQREEAERLGRVVETLIQDLGLGKRFNLEPKTTTSCDA